MESWKDVADKITPGQIEGILNALGVEVQSETESNYMAFCPFHANTHSAALSISKDTGLFYCFGAGCNARGNIYQLITKVKNCSYYSALRLAEKNKTNDIPLAQRINKIKEEQALEQYDPERIQYYIDSFWKYDKPKLYMNSRGVKNSTSKHFNVGYDPKGDRIIVPVYDRKEMPVGYVGRFIEYKSFKNSKGLPSSKTLYNYHNARGMSNKYVIVVESSFDAMRVYQATGKAVVATLGGTFSDIHLGQIRRSFDGIILGVDGDVPGQKFAKRIYKKCSDAGLAVKQAEYSGAELFPKGAKDFGDCTDEQIATMIDGACAYVP